MAVDADLGALEGQALAEEQDQPERDRGDERDEPGVLQEPHGSALHRVELVESDAATVAVDEQDEGEADADLGGGDRDHEQREHLPFTSLPLFSAKAIRLMLTAFRISSIDISTSTAFLRASTP